MSKLQKQVHIKNIRNAIHSKIIYNITEEVKQMNFEIFLNIFCEYKINYNNDIHIREYKYHIVDITYHKSLRYNIIDDFLIFKIKNILNFYFGYNNVALVYYLTDFDNNIIASFYLQFGEIEDLHFVIVS